VVDVETSNEFSIFTRENQYGKNKTSSGLRKLPLSILLPPDELAIYKQFLKRRLHDVGNNRNSLLFSQCADIDIPYSQNIFHRTISVPLSHICGENASCHTLRHKAISTLQIVLCSQQLLNITPYNLHQIEVIKRFFSCSTSRDILFEIAAFAGHLNPSITLETYMHFTDVILFEHLVKNQVCMSKVYWANLAGISKHIMTRRSSAECPSSEEILFILLEALCGKQNASKMAYTTCTELLKIQYPPKSVGFEDCLSALKLFEKEATLEQVIDSLQVDGNKISLWLDHATKLTSLCTSKGKPRLFPSGSKNRLAPIPPSSNIEYQKALLIIDWLCSCKLLLYCIHEQLNRICS
jgi:hypothetical protein